MANGENKFDLFIGLFNRDGYVLDFSNARFDSFTAKSVGTAVQAKYGLSKGKSLKAYLNDLNVDGKEKWKLVKDLLEYYEQKYEQEYTPDLDRNDYIPGINAEGVEYNKGYSKLYYKCKNLLINHNKIGEICITQTDLIKKELFTSTYLQNEIDLMINEIESNPTDAIGKSKELIESCCKTILSEMNIEYDKKWDLSALTNKTLELLKLTPNTISDDNPVSSQLRAICGNLRGIVTKLAEIRNVYGSGHGKEDEFKGLEERHAQLAVGCSATFCLFVWNTWKKQKNNINNF